MLPLIPIVAAVTSAAILLHRKISRKQKIHNFNKLVAYVKQRNIPVDINGNFNPDARLKLGTPLLFDVMPKQDLFTSLLEYGANPNICNKSGVPAIIYALKSNQETKIILQLLSYGANPNAMDSDGKTAIFYARSRYILTELLNAGADFNAVDSTGKTAIFDSLANQTTEDLVDMGVDINSRDLEGKNVVFYANTSMEFDILKEAGADFNAVDNTGRTALFYAVKSTKVSKLKELLEHGADPNAKDSTGRSVIFYANSESDFDVLKSYNADFNQPDPRGQTPIFYSNDIQTVQALLERGANANARDNDGKTVAFCSLHCNNFRLIKLFEDYGLDIHATDNSGNRFSHYPQYKRYNKRTRAKQAITISALYSAVNCNNIDEARRQLMEGANPDTRDPYVKGWNMIHLAVHKNNPEMIEVLFKGGVNINGSPRGISPLEKAVYDKNLDCFKKLLELGADPKRAKVAILNSGTSEMKDIFNKYKTK